MRIIVTSDTHYLGRWRQKLEANVAEIAALKPDCLVVGGDVGERLSGFEHMLTLLQAVDCPRLVLTGNHDLWSDADQDSKSLWETVLPRLTRKSGAIWLEGENWSQNGLAICGTNGWYDYSGRDPSIELTDAEYFEQKRYHMVDGELINWPWTDIEFARMLGKAFSARLDSLDANPSIREILVVTHVPVFAEAIIRRPEVRAWALTNAYFYNLTLGKRIAASRKVTRVISGHIHVGTTATVKGAGGAIDMRVIDADYGRPAYVVLDYP